jgi:hypothetical protein
MLRHGHSRRAWIWALAVSALMIGCAQGQVLLTALDQGQSAGGNNACAVNPVASAASCDTARVTAIHSGPEIDASAATLHPLAGNAEKAAGTPFFSGIPGLDQWNRRTSSCGFFLSNGNNAGMCLACAGGGL